MTGVGQRYAFLPPLFRTRATGGVLELRFAEQHLRTLHIPAYVVLSQPTRLEVVIAHGIMLRQACQRVILLLGHLVLQPLGRQVALLRIRIIHQHFGRLPKRQACYHQEDAGHQTLSHRQIHWMLHIGITLS